MPKLIPMGARLMVVPLESETSLEKRAEAVGLKLIIEEKNKPRATRGRVVAVGPDPLLQAHVSVGDEVWFSVYAGIETHIEGVTYLSLELKDITHVLKPDEVPLPSHGPQSPCAEN